MSSLSLAGRVALVTGATGGLGEAIARALGEAGARLFLTGTRAEALEALLARLRAGGMDCQGTALRLDGAASAGRLSEEAERVMGPVDVLVNSAGINRPQRAEEVSEENWDAILAINLSSLFFVCQAVGRRMIARRRGTIVNVSSQAGSVALPLRAAYCASKGGVDQLTRELAVEWAAHGVTVNAVAPTFVETPLVTGMFRDAAFKKFVIDSIPLGRMATPAEVGDAVLFLAGDMARMITGHVLAVDGGWTVR